VADDYRIYVDDYEIDGAIIPHGRLMSVKSGLSNVYLINECRKITAIKVTQTDYKTIYDPAEIKETKE